MQAPSTNTHQSGCYAHEHNAWTCRWLFCGKKLSARADKGIRNDVGEKDNEEMFGLEEEAIEHP